MLILLINENQVSENIKKGRNLIMIYLSHIYIYLFIQIDLVYLIYSSFKSMKFPIVFRIRFPDGIKSAYRAAS